jgi:hypothetical protein
MTPDAVDLAAKVVLAQLVERRKRDVESKRKDIKTSKLINHFYSNG